MKEVTKQDIFSMYWIIEAYSLIKLFLKSIKIVSTLYVGDISYDYSIRNTKNIKVAAMDFMKKISDGVKELKPVNFDLIISIQGRNELYDMEKDND